MALTDYTSYAEIRAALGIASLEVRDNVLALPLYERLLQFELKDISPTIEAAYLALGEEGSLSDPELTFYSAMQVYAAYAVAYRLTDVIEMSSFQKIQDSKTAFTRKVDYNEVRLNVAKGLSQALTRLVEAYNEITPTIEATIPTLLPMTGVGLGTDPVTDA
jgi:hypothetical protein